MGKEKFWGPCSGPVKQLASTITSSDYAVDCVRKLNSWFPSHSFLQTNAFGSKKVTSEN